MLLSPPAERSSIRAYACEHETLHLECGENESISIKSANYGRLHRNVCSNNGWNKNTDSCRSDAAIFTVRQTCDNHRSCDLPATNEKFGNPCGNIYKYLEVEYSCEGEISKLFVLIRTFLFVSPELSSVIVSPELSSVRDYVITHSVCSM